MSTKRKQAISDRRRRIFEAARSIIAQLLSRKAGWMA